MARWWPFKAASILDRDEEEWQLETWRWLLSNFRDQLGQDLHPIATPTPTFFPPTRSTGHALAEQIFESVKRHAGMEDWPCRLVAQPRRPNLRIGDVAALQVTSGHAPLGTFGVAGSEAVITYDPAGLDDLTQLVATLAHELAHYRLAGVPTEPPGGADALEFATDLTTVYLGFGLFGANSAFNFRQYQDVMSQGWEAARQGYLSEREWVFALAVYLELRQQSSTEAKSFLKPHLYSDLRKAQRYFERNPHVLAVIRR